MSWVIRGAVVLALLGLTVWLLGPAPDAPSDHAASSAPAASASKPAPAASVSSTPPVPAVSTISIEQIGEDYQSSEATATQKYAGMRLRTTGKATEIGETLGEPWINLEEGGARVTAYLLKDQTDKVSTVSRGQRVIVDCAKSDLSGAVNLRQCSLEALLDAGGVQQPPKAQELPPATSTHPAGK